MSKVFNMVGGGGGGKNISSIIITGLENTDTVTCTKDGKSYTSTWNETAQRFEIVGLPLGTFTIIATHGTKTKTETVLIDIAGVHEIEMSFKFWLFKDGDEYTDVTGGWKTGTTNGVVSASVGPTLYSESKGKSYAYEYWAYVYTNNVIDWSKYSKLNVLIAFGTKSNNPAASLMAGFSSFSSNANPTMQKNVNISSYLSAGRTNFTVTMDISDIDTTTQLALLARSDGPSGYGDVFLGAHFLEVWLE